MTVQGEALSFRYPAARIAVFAREPVLGEVKTRLIPTLGAAAALSLYQAMAERVISLVRDSALAELSLWVVSNPSHEWFVTNCINDEIHTQAGADLGLRMGHCAATLLARPEVDRLLIIGTDCPALTADYLEAALQALSVGADVVLGPAADGGYVLLGLNRPIAALFEGVQWGSEKVLQQTLDKAGALGLQVKLLPTLWDVDRVEDLQRLAELHPPLRWDSGKYPE